MQAPEDCPSIVFASLRAIVAGEQLLQHDQSWLKTINAQHLPWTISQTVHSPALQVAFIKVKDLKVASMAVLTLALET